MKLSEAIIKGCEGTRKLRHRMFNGRGGCCVLGAACLGAGIETGSDIAALVDAEQMFPAMRAWHTNPVTGTVASVSTICIDLNDNRRWPRLSIAEWIANVVEPELCE